ncbi:Ig-like domain-containing protein [Butyrivibrio sp. JL13D10]|uniref:Ig-like domain-containing protein n=1 Tax=Butyrivibrio sp. JL13D10 TaxID=3236815 RepID=UPI0038B63B51
MKKNKKIWSYALACALAMSNLSVVAAPFSSIVAQAATTEVTAYDVTFPAASAQIEKGTTVVFSVADEAEDLVAGAALVPLTSDGKAIENPSEVINVTALTDADAGKYKVEFLKAGKYKIKASKSGGESTVNIGISPVITVTSNYTAQLDGKEWIAGYAEKGKTYDVRVMADTVDVTTTANITVEGPATYSNRKLTINSTAIDNAKVKVYYQTAEMIKKESLPELTVKDATATETMALSLDPKTASMTYNTTTPITTLVGKGSVPSGYTLDAKYRAYVESGNGVLVEPKTAYVDGFSSSNIFTITATEVAKKETVVVKYILKGTATNGGTVTPDRPASIDYEGEIEQTVTVYPAPKYELTVTGDNQDKTNKRLFTLKEEEGSIKLTASIDPAGKDIPAIEDVKYVWSVTPGTKIKVSGNGPTATITPVNPFTATLTEADYETVRLTITEKDGTTPITTIQDTEVHPYPYEAKIKLATESKPSITADKTDIKANEAVTFTIKDASGKTITDLTGYEIKDNGSTIPLDSKMSYTFASVGSHKITVKDTTRKLESDPVTITVRSEDGQKATGLRIDKTEIELNDDSQLDDYKISVTVLPDGAEPNTNAAEINTVTVKSSDSKVVTTTQAEPINNETIITLSDEGPGEATIEITADDPSVTLKKTVKVTVAGYKKIEISGDDEVEVGATTKLNADVQVYGKKQSKDIIWHSTDEDVATVKDGVVTGVAEGTTTIYATLATDDSKKSNELEITVVDNTIPNAIKAAEAAADAAVANPTDATIKAAQDAIAAAKTAGATDAQLKSANDKVAKAVEAKKAADEAAKKAADGSAKDTPAPVNTELKDAAGATFKVTNATAGSAEVAYVAPADKNAKSATIPDTITDASGNVYKVTSIPANAFKKSKATKVTIGANIKDIDPKAFKGSKVKTIVVKGTKLTKKMAKAIVKYVKEGGKVQCKGANKKANKKLLKKQSRAKSGKVKIK